MDNFEPTGRTTLKRLPARGNYEREMIYKILDEGFVCHVGFVVENRPVVIPTGYGRKGETLYLHGSAASRMLKTLREGVDVCVTVTLVDGLVLARSSFHHSMNYRSVVIFGRAEVLEDENEKMEALRSFTDHVMRRRWEEARLPTRNELRATMVLALPLHEASAKIRTGQPIDDEEDYELPVWAGVLPLRLAFGEAIPDPRLPEGTALPGYIHDYARPQGEDDANYRSEE
ncbi:MAG TPA: pyridoxamine 5'-phosphate oxidase family protein [Pyrinomonadaceae bacterium]|nr:pyridoxamine 5'-phosphate oxidase family protein [Pyrinomonadaceae bacterium]